MYQCYDLFKAPQKIVLKCLQESTNSGFFSLAFPALGTGYLNYSKEYVAKTMFAGVEKFNMNNPNSSVTDVKFVIYHADNATLEAFKSACDRKRDAGLYFIHLFFI
jgi:poly [ADP-ribose] polymerase 10/14/15